jgi:hypothetical protein
VLVLFVTDELSADKGLVLQMLSAEVRRQGCLAGLHGESASAFVYSWCAWRVGQPGNPGPLLKRTQGYDDLTTNSSEEALKMFYEKEVGTRALALCQA